MVRFSVAALAFIFALAGGHALRADEAEVKAVLDKAIKALGGEEKLAKAKALKFKTRETISFNGNDSEVSGETTVQGLHQRRSEFEGEFNGNKFKGVTVVNNDKGWRKFGDMARDLDSGALANEKRNIYLQVIPMTIVPVKGEGFKV